MRWRFSSSGTASSRQARFPFRGDWRACTDNGVVTGAEPVHAFVIGQLHARWAEFDRAVVVAAHRAMMNLDDVAAIDDQVEIQTPCAEFRSASRRMGEAMLAVFGVSSIGDVPAYRNLIKRGMAYGHLAPMQGYCGGGPDLSERMPSHLSAHTFCTGLLGAGLRLGCLTHIDAQRIMIEARREAAGSPSCPCPRSMNSAPMRSKPRSPSCSTPTTAMRVFAN